MENVMRRAKYLFIIMLLLCGSAFAASRDWDLTHARKYNNIQRYSPKYQAARADSATGFDVQKYEITLSISQDPNYIQGKVLATVLAESALPSITYELVGLTVSGVKVNGSPSTYTHANGLLTIPVNAQMNDTFTTEVFYSGTPQLSGAPYNCGMIFRSNAIFTISDPDAGRFWWPCYDHPWDKAVIDLIITLRSDWKVAANGLRESIIDNGDGTSTSTWRGSHPMTTYLVCITAGPYVEIPQTALNGELPILNFVSSSQYNNALTDLSRLPLMIDYYSELFGTYPFEKYGNATVNMSTFGAMEHQTMTTLGNYIITGTQSQELVIAHELAHQWFGNAVSFLDFPDVWLSEGFATYSEHLWVDKTEGWQSACDYVLSSYHNYYKNWEANRTPPAIYNPDFANYFSPPSYEKAASVLHMLRLKMGDPLFFEFLQDWFATYKHGNVITSEFQQMAETHLDQDLTQFFQQWIFGTGIPSVQLTPLLKPSAQQMKVIATSTSPTATDFVVDLPLKLTQTAGADSLLITASPEGQSNLFEDVQSFGEIIPNYHNWTLLKEIEIISPQLTRALGSFEAIKLYWQSFSGATGYQAYYRPLGSENWLPANQGGTNHLNSCYVIGLDSGMEYELKLIALMPDGFQSLDSNVLRATTNVLPFTYELLVVDETRDGNGNPLNPTDEMVDTFYAAALAEHEYHEWDVAAEGLPSLEVLGNYRTTIWHADDNNQNLAWEMEDTLIEYLHNRGNLIIGGWRCAASFSDDFWSFVAPHTTRYYDQAPCLIGVYDTEFPDLTLDQSKLPAAWNGMLPMVSTFSGSIHDFYQVDMPEGFNGTGKCAATRIGDRSWFMGVPLYYFEQQGVKELLDFFILLTNTAISEEVQSPALLSLKSYPNPFNPSTNITFDLPSAGKASLKVYNIKGQMVKLLADESFAKGSHTLSLELPAKPSGIYILALESNGKRITKRISLVK